jgi:hypothetical protein
VAIPSILPARTVLFFSTKRGAGLAPLLNDSDFSPNLTPEKGQAVLVLTALFKTFSDFVFFLSQRGGVFGRVFM